MAGRKTVIRNNITISIKFVENIHGNDVGSFIFPDTIISIFIMLIVHDFEVDD